MRSREQGVSATAAPHAMDRRMLAAATTAATATTATSAPAGRPLVHRLDRAEGPRRPAEHLVLGIAPHADRRHSAARERLGLDQRDVHPLRDPTLLVGRGRREQQPRDRLRRRLEQLEAAGLRNEARLCAPGARGA